MVSVGKIASDENSVREAAEAKIHIFTMKNAHYGGPFVTTPGNLLASRNSHSWADIGPENAISVEDLRYPENRRRGGPADTPRAHISDRSFGEGVTLCCPTRLMASRMLCFGGAAADFPGLRPFRRGSLSGRSVIVRTCRQWKTRPGHQTV